MKKLTVGTPIVCCLLLFLVVFQNQTQGNEVVVFKVKIVVDKDYQIVRGNNKWRQSATALIEQVNQELQNQGAKVKFEIAEISGWRINKKTKTLLQALDDLKRKFPKDNCDLVIGLTRKNYSAECDAGGYYLFPDYIIVKDYTVFNLQEEETIFTDWTLLILIHEIGHFFDLDHSDNPDSIMHSEVFGKKFLKEEIEIINKRAREMKSVAP